VTVAADATLRSKGKVGDPFSSPWRRRLPLLPALLFAIAITQLPFLVSIYYSFTNLKDKTQSLIPEPTKFVGIDNYKAIFSDPFFRQAVLTSVKMTVLAVVLSLVFGTLFAILLDRKFVGQGLVRTLLITPFLLMPVVAALIWKQQMFSSLFGILDKVLAFLGLNAVAFISDHPLGSIVTVLVWQWTPFMMLIMLAGLQSQTADIAAPASVPGARCAARFDLHRPGVRRHRRDDRRRSRLDEHPVLRLPGVDRWRIPLRLGVRVRDSRRRLFDHHRDVRAARAVRALQGRGAGVSVGLTELSKERRRRLCRRLERA